MEKLGPPPACSGRLQLLAGTISGSGLARDVLADSNRGLTIQPVAEMMPACVQFYFPVILYLVQQILNV